MSFQSFFFYLGKIAENLGVAGCKPKDFQTAKCLVKSIASATECVGRQLNQPDDSVTLNAAPGQTYEYTFTSKMVFVIYGTSVGSNVDIPIPFETTYLEVAGQEFDLEEHGLIGRMWILCPGDKIILTNNGASALQIRTIVGYV